MKVACSEGVYLRGLPGEGANLAAPAVVPVPSTFCYCIIGLGERTYREICCICTSEVVFLSCSAVLGVEGREPSVHAEGN